MKRNNLISVSLSIKADRRRFIGGSDTRIEAEPEDLSANLVVQLGIATEALNRTWYERHTGRRIVDVPRRVHHPVINRWMAATLDGMVEHPRPCSRPVHAAVVVLSRGGCRKAYGPSSSTRLS
jgi:hypothetical protein